MLTVKKHLSYITPFFATNTFLVEDEVTGEMLLVDPGVADDKLLEKVKGKNVKYVLLTHGHFDHICGAKMIKDNTGAKIVIHKEDEELLLDREKNVIDMYCPEKELPNTVADILVDDGDEISFAGGNIKVLHTPGHTKGGVCYIFSDDQLLFSGDTLFKLSAGRTDYYSGNPREELMSLAKIADLDGDYNVYPGHDDSTTLDFERENNRYMRTRFRRK